jgi:O-antigen/teichoic acid export membrane protein
LAFTPNWVFFLVFTDKFIDTATITRSLAVPFIVYPVISFAHLFLLYTVKKPHYILMSNVVLFIVITGGCSLFIPAYGIQAAIYSIAAAFLLSGILLTFLSFREYERME